MMGEGMGLSDVDVKLGGRQIEYEDEAPVVRQMFAEACARAGIESQMGKDLTPRDFRVRSSTFIPPRRNPGLWRSGCSAVGLLLFGQ
jgi:hypothetical protein